MNERAVHGVGRLGAGMAMSLLLVVVGCGKRMGDVSGTVSYQGTPLPNGDVAFFDKNNLLVGSSPIVNGKYRIRRVPSGTVTITVTVLPPPKSAAGGKSTSASSEFIALPPMYGDPAKSGLTFPVKPGSQKHPIELN
ncbi:MAG TPA: hypothetical protein VMF69_25375 [Gemmataceae bacterium]|nr:hypothetical protein [Gemmataceae bacterium]